MTVFFIGCTFVVFVLMLMIILIYLQQTSTSSSKFNKRVEIARREIKPVFFKLINNKNIKDEHIEELRNHLINRVKITAFNNIYLDYIEAHGISERSEEIISKVITDDIIFNKNIYKGKYKTDYALYLYYFYGITTDSSIKYAFDNLTSDSLYTRNNAIMVIENSKDANNYVKALEIINKEKDYISEKIIIDFLISFKGDRTEFNHILVTKMDDYSKLMRKFIINYFRIRKYEADEIINAVLDVLKEEENKELLISAIKYFGAVYEKKAQKYIEEYLKSDIVELKLLVSKYAYKYPSDIVKRRLKRNLMDTNWYVRNNAAYSLVRMDYTDSDVKEILENKDKFAKETFEQALNNKKVK